MPGNDTESKELNGPSAPPGARKVTASLGTDAPKSQRQPRVRLGRKTTRQGSGSLAAGSKQPCRRPGKALDTRDRLLSPGADGNNTTSSLVWGHGVVLRWLVPVKQFSQRRRVPAKGLCHVQRQRRAAARGGLPTAPAGLGAG